jgi:hypothetical protein
MRGFPRLGRECPRDHAPRDRLCADLPGLSETTIYSSEAPNGFYKQLIAGKVPAWLQPVQLPKDWPYKMWRVVK